MEIRRCKQITLCCHTAEQFCMEADCKKEELEEWYGKGVKNLYDVEYKNDCGALIGVEYEDGHYSVYGCRRDEEGITFAEMLERLVREFV